MLVGGIVAVLVVAGAVAVALIRRRSHDDVYSVEHYHRQLHTLEEMRAHPADALQNGNDETSSSYPATAFRVSGSSAVRLTEPGRPVVPPVPPPPVPNPAEPVAFDDEKAPEPAPATFMSGSDDRAMHGINHRPRRLGAPLAAVAAVLVLIAVLIAAGIHSNTPGHGKAATTATTTPAHRSHGSHGSQGSGRHPATSTTTTTAAPAVSTPQASSAHAATYQVASADYSLDLAATAGECWVEATNTATGSVLFTATLFSGQSHSVAASGPVTVIAGAPGAFAATVDGAAVSLPPGNQAPFTLHFVTASTGAGAGGSAGTGTTGGTGAGGVTTPTT